MPLTREALAGRARELEALADAAGLDWKGAAATLASDDPVARIGLLAAKLGIDIPTALDPDAPLEAPAAAA
jgi:hypothetical protein